MKLRDRQEKVERMISFYKSSKGSPFQEASTHVRGEVDVVGAMLVMDDVDEQHCDTIQMAGIRNGVDLRFVFESAVRQTDTLVAEFVAGGKGQGNALARPLSLTKVVYVANFSDWFSAIAVPLGAQCKDVGVTMSSFDQEKCLTAYSAFGPPLLNQHNGSALGLSVRKSNVAASLAQFVSGPKLPVNSAGIMQCFSTFGHIVCQLSRSTKLSILGVHKTQKLFNKNFGLGAMTIPVGMFKQRKLSEASVEEDHPQTSIDIYRKENLLHGSLAVMLESELDDSTRIGGWLEMRQSNARYLQWAITVSDTPADDVGWGLSMGGLVEGPRSWEHFQVEGFLNFNVGRRFRFKPAVLYLHDRRSHIPALMLQSSWSL